LKGSDEAEDRVGYLAARVAGLSRDDPHAAKVVAGLSAGA
jgi:hypothetical protein